METRAKIFPQIFSRLAAPAAKGRWLFRRYAQRHLVVERHAPAVRRLAAPIGETLAVERICLREGRLRIAGHTNAPRLSLTLAGMTQGWTNPCPDDGTHGFSIEFPLTPGQILTETPARGRYRIKGFGSLDLRIASLRLVPKFVTACAANAGLVWHWLRTGDPVARAAFRDRLGLGRGPNAPLLATLPERLDIAPQVGAAITIVLPVYNAPGLLADCLDRIAAHTDLPWRLCIVDDCSPDPKVQRVIADWRRALDPATAARVTSLRNMANAGFVITANRGLAAAMADPEGGEVVLLNSDALVPPNWASRLVAPIWADARVASVTPLSNNAELLSVPVLGQATALVPGEAEALDKAAQAFAATVEVPTGVGFCMAMNRAFLAKLPQFDTCFSPGYCEEVDWCRKAVALGGRNVVQCGLFVEHVGGASFGNAAKRQLIDRNHATLERRHPDFAPLVRRFCDNDPIAIVRLALALSLLSLNGAKAVPVYLAHSLGGGAEDALARQIADNIAGGPGAVVLRVGGLYRWQVEVHCAAGITRGASDDWHVIRDLLRQLHARRIFYSCGVGDRDPVTLPGRLVELTEGGTHPLEVCVHDYFMLSPSHTLIGREGVFAGLPAPETDDPRHRTKRPDGTEVCLRDWQDAWSRLLGKATGITCYSKASRSLLCATWPDLHDKISISPHRALTSIVPRHAPALGTKPVIGVLGNIGAAKGGAVLATLTKATRGHHLKPRFVIIGEVDPAFRLARGTLVHGAYARQDIAALALRYDIGCWLIPSVWPETFSFVTHEALATGLPVACFDLGAQAEAVRHAKAQGLVLSLAEVLVAPVWTLDSLLERIEDRAVQIARPAVKVAS